MTQYPRGCYKLLETLGFKIDDYFQKFIILVDRKRRLNGYPNYTYRFRVLSVIIFKNDLYRLFDYNECKVKAEYFDITPKNTLSNDEIFINCIQEPFIFEYTFDKGKLVSRIYRILNNADMQYYEKIKQQYNIGDPTLVDDGLIHFESCFH